jgi:glycosyltransferase involved in cell wall biosynthesis
MTHQGDFGGSTNSIAWLCRGMAEHGHDVFLACRPESLIASRFPRGPVRCVEMRLPRGLALVGESFRWKRWIDDERIDVVNANASLDRHLVSYLRLLGSRAALVHTRRNVVRSTGGTLRGRWDAATTDAIVAVSQDVADSLLDRGVPARRVEVIRNGIPLAELRDADPGRVEALRRSLELVPGVPVVGVVARRKSQEDLLDAAGRLGRPLHVLLAGITEDPEIARRAAALPAGVRVRCLGFRDDVAELSALLDVFVLPSTIEGFSLALLEAMARGLPCVATDAGGNREALGEGAGRLYPPGDAPALARVLGELLDDVEAARALGARARERVRREFDLSRTVARTLELYVRLAAERA